MAENPHFKGPLRRLNECEVRYLIVGGYAIMKYSEPRFTKDLDIWVENSAENAIRVFEALTRFGAPLDSDKINRDTFTEKDLTYQMGSSGSLHFVTPVDCEQASYRPQQRSGAITKPPQENRLGRIT